jgi:hypothetical protein
MEEEEEFVNPQVVKRFFDDHLSHNPHTKTFFQGATEFLQMRGVPVDPSDQRDITGKMMQASDIFKHTCEWLNGPRNHYKWKVDEKNKVLYKVFEDIRPEKKRTEKIILIIAFHGSIHSSGTVTKFLQRHEDNRVMIVKILD